MKIKYTTKSLSNQQRLKLLKDGDYIWRPKLDSYCRKVREAKIVGRELYWNEYSNSRLLAKIGDPLRHSWPITEIEYLTHEQALKMTGYEN